MSKTSFIESGDGHQLFFREHFVEPAVQSVILIHGFAEHSGRYEHVINALAQEKINVLAFDLRGHGRSQGKRGYIDSFSQYVEDVKAAVNFTKKRYQVKKVILLAHSMGALVAVHYASECERNLEGMVLSSPLLGIRNDVPKWKTVVGYLMSKYCPSFQLASSISGHDLTHDHERAQAYDSDPLVFHHIAARWFTEIKESYVEAKNIAPRLKIPMLLQLSNADRIVDERQSIYFFKKCTMKDRTQLIYDGFFHEIYNEKECVHPIMDAVNWIKVRGIQKRAGLKSNEASSPGIFV